MGIRYNGIKYNGIRYNMKKESGITFLWKMESGLTPSPLCNGMVNKCVGMAESLA